MTPITLDELSSQPASLKEWIDYQSGSIVSRKLIQASAGAVTAFAFDGGQALSEHTAPFDALAQVLEGEATITIAGQAHQMKSGEILILPANKPHAVQAGQRFKMLLTMIRS